MAKLSFQFFAKPLALVALVAQIAFSAGAARAETAPDMTLIGDAELKTLCGGFTLPDGANINVGISNQISINGVSVADAQLDVVGSAVKVSTSGLGQILGTGGVTNILQLAAAGPTVVANSANNIVLNQLRTINVDISNYSGPNLQAMNNIAALQNQLINGFRNSIH